jgi:hypothetical protein
VVFVLIRWRLRGLGRQADLGFAAGDVPRNAASWR